MNNEDRHSVVVKATSGWITSTYPEVRQSLAGQIAASAYTHAALNALSFNLFIALISAESGFNPKARSQEGARGLTQVMVKHHRDKIRGRDIFNPEVAIEVGAVILRDCYVRFKVTDRALRCYTGYRGKDASDYIARVKTRARHIAQLVHPPVHDPDIVETKVTSPKPKVVAKTKPKPTGHAAKKPNVKVARAGVNRHNAAKHHS